MNTRKAVFLDNDGTMLRSIEIAHEAACAVIREAGGRPPAFDEYVKHAHPPFAAFYARCNVFASEAKLWQEFSAIVDFDRAELFPDVLDVLDRLSARGRKLGLISAQHTHILHRLCGQHGIMRFFNAGVVGDANEKHFAIKAMCEDIGVLPENVDYVGDTPSDMIGATLAGVRAVGITRGNDIRSILEAAGASLVIEHLDELLNHV